LELSEQRIWCPERKNNNTVQIYSGGGGGGGGRRFTVGTWHKAVKGVGRSRSRPAAPWRASYWAAVPWRTGSGTADQSRDAVCRHPATITGFFKVLQGNRNADSPLPSQTNVVLKISTVQHGFGMIFSDPDPTFQLVLDP
jgi:hypothetical protein